MAETRSITPFDARWIGGKLGVDWKRFTPEQFRLGMEAELAHCVWDIGTSVTDDDLLLTGQLALAHLSHPGGGASGTDGLGGVSSR